MSQILVTLQIFIVLALVVLVFMQKSDDEGVANLTKSSEGMGRRSGMTLMNKITMVVAFIFMINSVAMARLENVMLKRSRSLLHSIENIENNKSENNSNNNEFQVKELKKTHHNDDSSGNKVPNSIVEKSNDNKNHNKTEKKDEGSNISNIPLIGGTENNEKGDVNLDNLDVKK